MRVAAAGVVVIRSNGAKMSKNPRVMVMSCWADWSDEANRQKEMQLDAFYDDTEEKSVQFLRFTFLYPLRRAMPS